MWRKRSRPVRTARLAPSGAGAPSSFDTARAGVEDFCRRHFSFRGSLRLHRAALGWDLLRAPANVLLAVPNLVRALLVPLLRLLGRRRVADWLARHPLMLRTAVSRRIDDLIRSELLPAGAAEADPHLIRYAEARGAVAEITTQIGTLGTGALAFKSLTPGLVSLAPAVALTFAQSAAIAAFPLGGFFGAGWYALFPAAASPGLTWGLVLAFALLGALFTTFAGLIADPVQRLLGLHQRRLRKLIDAAEGRAAGLAPKEPYLARLGDVADIAATVTRLFRG